ncbi:hypothetical protein HPB47_008792 [Ixodes persulcatus]|uniref:Uncharacterized protein n=1 Tax=Ixodes persulcatus TaxID=34615 RepID=A0AC60P3S3_IXOPE|nr:hypothetical protein HPB47_008792 [Ixodes persulcatus]
MRQVQLPAAASCSEVPAPDVSNEKDDGFGPAAAMQRESSTEGPDGAGPYARVVDSKSAPTACRRRRSQRLRGQEQKQVPHGAPPIQVVATRTRQPMGDLQRLPPELLVQIFLRCEACSLGVLSMCSKALRDRVAEFVGSNSGVRSLGPPCPPSSVVLQYCRTLGVLMKRITCLFPTKERLKMMLRFIEMYVSRPRLVRSRLIRPGELEASVVRWRRYGAFIMAAIAGWDDAECLLVHELLQGITGAHSFASKCVSRPRLVRSRLIRPGELEASVVRWRRYGAFIMAAIAGWDDAECLLVHELLQGITGAHSFASKVLSARPDRFRRDELALRSFVRSLFLREASEDEAVAWLSRLLAPWPLVFRAKLLYLVYGPCCQHAIFWDVPSVPQSAAQSELLVTALSELGSALRSLHEHGLGWTHDDTVTVLEELIVLPRAWLPLNAASLLCLCGRDIAVLVLASKLVNGRDSDVATFIFNMLLVDCRSATNVSLVLNVVLDLRGLFPGRRHLSLLPEMSDSLLRSAVDFHTFDGINGNEEACHALLSMLAVLLNGFCEQAVLETAPEE